MGITSIKHVLGKTSLINTCVPR